jgi:nitroreductase
METEVLSKTVYQNDTIESIYERRAVRKYKNKPVAKRIIEQLLEAGRMAPSAMNRQPWKFYVVTNKELIHLLSRDIAKKAFKDTLKKGVKNVLKSAKGLFHFVDMFRFSSLSDPIFYGAPVVIFITSPGNNEWANLDIGMCAQNMMLAAKSLGLESCPVGFGKFVENTEHYPSLQIPANERVELSVIFGYGAETPEVHERETKNAVFVS